MQQWGVNHCETYFPVVKLMSIVAMLTLSIIREIHNKSVDFVLAYSQDDVIKKILI